MAFRARQQTVCSNCGETISIGQEIGWSRHGNPRKTYHASINDCPYAPESTATVESPAIQSNQGQDISAVLKALEILSKQASPTVEAAPVVTPVVIKTDLSGIDLLKASWEVKVKTLSQHFSRLLIIGPPGTGKSTLADGDNMAVKVLCHEDMSVSDLRGMFHLVKGETKWVDGPSTRAMKQGTRIVLDEVERSSMEARSLLYNLLDHPAHDTLPTGEVVHAKPGYSVIATSNESPKCLPQAILDRFDLIIFAYTPATEVCGLIHDDMRSVTINYYLSQGKLAQPYKPVVSARNAMVYSRLRSLGVNQETSLELVYHQASKEIASCMATA